LGKMVGLAADLPNDRVNVYPCVWLCIASLLYIQRCALPIEYAHGIPELSLLAVVAGQRAAVIAAFAIQVVLRMMQPKRMWCGCRTSRHWAVEFVEARTASPASGRGRRRGQGEAVEMLST